MIQPLTKEQYLTKEINPLIEDVVDEFVNQINHFIAINNFVDERELYFIINLNVVCNKLSYSWDVLSDEILLIIENRYVEAGWKCKAGGYYMSSPYTGIKFYK